jgi:SAM-dependent methyltransferase
MTAGDGTAGEFDTVAAWTAEALTELPESCRIPGACRGSGNPSALAWLAEAMELTPSTRMLDAGGGIGGPAGWVAERYGVTPTVLEPMANATRWAGRLFDVSAVCGTAEQMPFATGSFDAVWALGVVSTVDDKQRLAAEIRRVLGPAGRVGLLEYVALRSDVPAAPAGNDFCSADEIDELLASAGLLKVNATTGASLPPIPMSWQARADRVKAAVAAAHPGAAVLADADEQEHRFAELLSDGTLGQYLVHATVM